MMSRATSFPCAVAIASLTAAASAWAADKRGEAIPLATPLGVTIQSPVGDATLLAQYKERAVELQYYGDAKGMALYTYEKDEPNKPTCYDDCAREWPPFMAPRGAKAVGDWTLVRRKGGGRQWAFHGKPLYTFAKDSVIGEARGMPQPKNPTGAKTVRLSPTQGSDSEAEQTPSPWRIASYTVAQIPAPSGISVQEVADANGEALVDARGMTLYVFSGDPDRDGPSCPAGALCENPWVPVPAARLTRPIGDFTFVGRQDGIGQWAYKGQALYSFVGDMEPGDANGIGVDERWQPALLRQFYLPAQVRIRDSLTRGKVIAAADGMTLYRRTSVVFGVRATRGQTFPIMPEMGRIIGTRSCDAQCMKTWIPLEAPARAQPAGFWEVLTRGDGKKQWSYKGYALYRYAGDKKPGDVNGNDIYQVFLNNDVTDSKDPASIVISQLRLNDQAALTWSHMYP